MSLLKFLTNNRYIIPNTRVLGYCRYSKYTHLPKPSSDNQVSCTTIDVNGEIKSMSKKYPKMEFIKINGLYPRDLRKVDNSSIDIVPTIAVRLHCILVNLLHIKSIIHKDSIMIFDTSDVSSIKRIGLFIYDLQDKLKTNSNHNTSFEFKALESILINVMSFLETDLNEHINICSTILTQLENLIDRSKLRDLLIHSKALSRYCQKALLIRDVLDELLETDEDLRGMYLSKAFQVPNRVELGSEDFNFNEIEILLENYYKQCDEFVQQASSLISDIKSTEEIVNIILDSNRNSLMLYDLKVTIYTLGFTVATTLPAFYGMNLKNFIEDSNVGFAMIVGASILSAIGITIINFRKLRSVEHLTMTARKNFTRGNSSQAQKVSKVQTNSLRQICFTRLPKWNRRFPFLSPRFLPRLDPKQRVMAWKWLVDGQGNK